MASLLSALKRTARYMPTVVVFAVLVWLAYWGHHSNWKLPKFAEFFGSQKAEEEDWCSLHNVPDSRCIACHPELGGTDPGDWCKEHGLPESKCTICHPDLLKGGTADWCPEHGIPEKSCTKCHPEIAVKSPAPPSEFNTIVSYASSAKPPKDPKTCQTHNLRVQFASPEAVKKAGVALAAVQERPMAAYATASGEVEYDQTRVARLSTRAPGIAWRVWAGVGKRVRRGDVLALVDSAEAGRAKAEFLQALAWTEAKAKLLTCLQSSSEECKHLVQINTQHFERMKSAAKDNLVTQTGFQDAELRLAESQLQALKTNVELEEAASALKEGRIRLFNAQQSLINLGLPIRIEDTRGLPDDKLAEKLRLLGLPDSITKDLDPGAITANLLPLFAPFDGEVVSRDVVAGEVLDTSKPIFVVADVTRMWIMLDVRQEDSNLLAVSQKVVFRPDGNTEEAVAGSITWISTAADEKTRTVKVRVDVANQDGRLRAHTFGSGRITIRETSKAIVVPNEAIHWEGCCHVVFVRLTDDIFQTRKVILGARNGPFTEVLIGVMPGEAVATTGSHVLKSEILKSSLGAGCCAE